jgi:hypothetical protein
MKLKDLPSRNSRSCQNSSTMISSSVTASVGHARQHQLPHVRRQVGRHDIAMSVRTRITESRPQLAGRPSAPTSDLDPVGVGSAAARSW